MIKTAKSLGGLSAIVLSSILSTACLAADLATGVEIKEALNDKTLQGGSGDDTFAEYYDPDGTIRGDGYTGKWRIVGDTGCMNYGEGETCWTAEIDAEQVIWRSEGEPDYVSTSTPGNIDDFQ